MAARPPAVAAWVDDRTSLSTLGRKYLRKVFPDHWSFLLGEIALYSFTILLLTGTFLTLFFHPSMTEVVYHGTYSRLDRQQMSEAYASTLNIIPATSAGVPEPWRCWARPGACSAAAAGSLPRWPAPP